MDECLGPRLSTPITPATTSMAFDLHRVIVHRSWRTLFQYLLHMSSKTKIILLLLSPLFWWRLVNLLRITTVSDDVFERLLTFYPWLARYERDFIMLENMQASDSAAVDILKDLKKRGFKLYLLSNIGERAYADLSKKLPDVFSIFDGRFSPLKKNGYKQKPAHEFYHDFLAYVVEQGDVGKQILFIDDRSKNIQAAAAAGLTACRFKSARGLKLLLQRVGA